jgi:ribose/xylose/arabinose/galactoside ABC-type transport system permease subunit
LAFLALTAVVLGGTPLGGGHGSVLGGLLAALLLIVGGNVAVLKQAPAENILIAQGAILLAAALLGQIFFGFVAWRFERK